MHQAQGLGEASALYLGGFWLAELYNACKPMVTWERTAMPGLSYVPQAVSTGTTKGKALDHPTGSRSWHGGTALQTGWEKEKNDQDLGRAEEEQSEWRWVVQEAFRARVHERHQLTG